MLICVPVLSATASEPEHRTDSQPLLVADESTSSSTGVLTGDPGSTGDAYAANGTPPTQSTDNQPSVPPMNLDSQDPPGTFLQGKVTVLGPGTHFRCQLDNTLDSSYTREGEQFLATVTEPVILDGQVAVPPGSKLTGQVTNVVTAKNFNFGINARIDVKFIAVQTPDGRKFPINASIDVKQLQAAGGANKNPGGRALRSAGKGAKRGAGYGAGAGAIYGLATLPARGSKFGRVAKTTAVGAIAGSVVGAGVGLASAGVKKGSEVKVPAGTSLPVQLDEPLTMDATNTPPTQQPMLGGYPSSPQGQPYGGSYQQPNNYYRPQGNFQPQGSYPPVQQPVGSYQQQTFQGNQQGQ